MLSYLSSNSESVTYRPPEFSDFSEYLPWAARSLCLEVDVEVKKSLLYPPKLNEDEEEEYDNVILRAQIKSKSLIDAKGKLVKSTPSPGMRTHNLKDTSQIIPLLDKKPVDESTVVIEALYDRKDCVARLIFELVPRNPNCAVVLKLISLQISQPQMSNLQRIVFKTGLDAQMLYEIKHFLSVSTVSEVILDYNFVPEANYDMLLEEKSQLKVLSIAGCRLGDDVLRTIMEHLKYPNNAWQSLRVLNLASNMITDIGAGYIAEALRSNVGLYSLDLSANQITDEGAVLIFNVLGEFPLTSDEITATKLDRMEYVRRKMVYVTEKAKLVQKCRTISPVGKKRHKGSKGSKVSDKDVTDAIGAFEHPFGKERGAVFVRDDYLYHYGNFNLKLLRLNYNDLTNCSVRYLLKVFRYQRNKGIKAAVGLMEVSLEGNRIVACEELDMIHYMSSHKYFTLKKREKSQRFQIGTKNNSQKNFINPK